MAAPQGLGLVACAACGSQVSPAAKACPSCGDPLKVSTPVDWSGLWGSFSLVLLIFVCAGAGVVFGSLFSPDYVIVYAVGGIVTGGVLAGIGALAATLRGRQ